MTDRIQGKISVLVPCFDEAPSIRANLEEIHSFFRDFAEQYEVICIDDGSRDNTRQELEAAAADHANIKVLRYEQNHGKGGTRKRHAT